LFFFKLGATLLANTGSLAELKGLLSRSGAGMNKGSAETDSEFSALSVTLKAGTDITTFWLCLSSEFASILK
jgi:hypothetical protein